MCAAIWYKELETMKFLPTNVSVGTVVCGHRHGHCINTMSTLAKLRTVTFAPDGVGEHIQGFLTNTNRFVDRVEGLEIAKRENQLLNPDTVGKILFSEDVW